jgi:hypothetical protein
VLYAGFRSFGAAAVLLNRFWLLGGLLIRGWLLFVFLSCFFLRLLLARLQILLIPGVP